MERIPLRHNANPDSPRLSSKSGNLVRSSTISVRLDPKLRYLTELAARKLRRTLSSYIEWAIEQSLSRVVIWEGEDYDGGPHVEINISEDANRLWDVDPADRFAKLALRHPYMLDHTEQIIWKLVCENGWFWEGTFTGPDRRYDWEKNERSLLFDRLREKWDLLNKVARGEAAKTTLPYWRKFENEVDDESTPF